jgi:hypothetical protein
MTIRELAYLGLRLTAVYIFSLALMQLGQLINVILQTYEANMLISREVLFFYSLAPVILLTILSIIIWFKTNKIIKYLVPSENTTDDEQMKGILLKQLQTLAFSVVGLILFARALPQFLQVFSEILLINNQLLQGPILYKSYLFIAQRILECVLGLVILLGAKGLSNILSKVRGA